MVRPIVTQAIGTLYVDGGDSIGWHQDKKKDIADDSLILDISFGGTRTFELRRIGEDSMIEAFNLAHGSLFILSSSTNDTWQHRIRPEANTVEPRASLVCRHIKTSIGNAEIQKKVMQRQRARGLLRAD